MLREPAHQFVHRPITFSKSHFQFARRLIVILFFVLSKLNFTFMSNYKNCVLRHWDIMCTFWKLLTIFLLALISVSREYPLLWVDCGSLRDLDWGGPAAAAAAAAEADSVNLNETIDAGGEGDSSPEDTSIDAVSATHCASCPLRYWFNRWMGKNVV